MAGDFDTTPEDYAEDVAKAKVLGVLEQVKRDLLTEATLENGLIIEAVCDELAQRFREM